MSAEKVTARLSIEMDTECPKCGNDIELFSGVDYLNDEGQLLGLVNTRTRKDWTNIGIDFECPICKQELVLDELEY